MFELTPIVIVALAFMAVAAIVFVLGRYFVTQVAVQRRLPVAAAGGDYRVSQSHLRLQAFIARNFDERRFGVDQTLRGKLRRDLVRAGYFRVDALNYYIFARIVIVLLLPLLMYVFAQF